MSKFTVTVEVDTEKKSIVIKDDAGNEKYVESVIVSGGDAQSNKFYLFGWGSAADLGWALATGFNSTGDPFYRKVFVHFTEWVTRFMGLKKDSIPIESQEILDVIEKWEVEDSKEDKKKFH